MENLFQLGMRDTDLSAPDGRRTSTGGVLKGGSKRVTTDHSSRAHDNEVLLASRAHVFLRLSGAYRTPPAGHCHESALSFNQWMWSRRSADSNEPSIFTMPRAR